jgi:virulence factor Mce-like protein
MSRIAAIALALAALWAGWSAVASAEDEARTYQIEMYNAFGIVEQSEVRVSGVNVGEVTGLDVNEDKRAVVSVEVSDELATFGDETTCSSEPQSLIAEYFIDCEPAGQPLEDGGTIPASRVSQTVQPDLVQNTMREPFKQRFRLLINEFGTGLAGNSEALNEAIRLGAPALADLKEVTATLRSQRETIRGLNEDSSQTIGELAERRDEIAAFVDEAEDTASISAARRDDVSTNFSLLDDFLGELRPSLVQLDRLARAQTPLLNNLRGAAPHLARLSGNLPAFNRNSEDALRTLGNAGDVGKRALRNGADEIALLADAGRKATPALEPLGDFLSDLDDPRRAVEIDERAGTDTGRTGTEPGRRDTMGYTGLEGLLNYVRNQTLAINQFDSVSHLFRFGIYEANTGLCGSFNSGRNPDTGELGIPAQGGGVTTDISEIADCAAWLGPNQGGLTPGHTDADMGLGPYDPAACPNGTMPADAQRYCDPGGPRREADRKRLGDDEGRDRTREPPNGNGVPELPLDPGGSGGGDLPDLDLPGLDDVTRPGTGQGPGKDGPGAQDAANDLLDFLFKP